ncbi:benzoate/H(+) symporter BenE family transporter [Dongia soli]|uniref:Benzoate/H(+) symporter BenE family transporter n=1 Tax=Dongia soli TaxID=600628 RepID=A0ABU5E8P4_9PROT|nr:benzoate/H(+) symporter BenE family transporter [Dongia soli]MDY0882730.1 benzoate/H(+) symporter BenE family transporter [Dongia soli]
MGGSDVAAIETPAYPKNIWPAVVAGILTAFVGYASSFTVVLQGLQAVGATPGQATSGLIAVGTAMGFAAIVLALRYRMPISIAWSTPGAALLASTGAVAGGFEAACGAFIACGVMIVIAGLWKPFGKLVSSIPAVLANAMLAGVLFGLCIAPFHAIAQIPDLALPVVLAWAVMARLKRLYAVPVAVLVAVIALIISGVPDFSVRGSFWPQVELVTPSFSWNAIFGIGLPLFLVTMASQNIPGLAVLRAFDYHPPASPLFVSTGIASLLSVPFGGYTVNLAAITAALCAAPEAHPDPSKRYIAAVVAGTVYVAFGAFAGVAASFISVSPPILIQAVAGLALLGAFGSAMSGALQNPSEREAAVITFVATASGMSIGGIGSAFWGLVAGGFVMALHRWRKAA